MVGIIYPPRRQYISGIYCQLGDYILPTTLYRNLKNPLIQRVPEIFCNIYHIYHLYMAYTFWLNRAIWCKVLGKTARVPSQGWVPHFPFDSNHSYHAWTVKKQLFTCLYNRLSRSNQRIQGEILQEIPWKFPAFFCLIIIPRHSMYGIFTYI